MFNTTLSSDIIEVLKEEQLIIKIDNFVSKEDESKNKKIKNLESKSLGFRFLVEPISKQMNSMILFYIQYVLR